MDGIYTAEEVEAKLLCLRFEWSLRSIVRHAPESVRCGPSYKLVKWAKVWYERHCGICRGLRGGVEWGGEGIRDGPL